MFDYQGTNRLGIALDVAQNQLDLLPQYQAQEDGTIQVLLTDLNGNVRGVLSENGEIHDLNPPFASYASYNKNVSYKIFESHGIQYPKTYTLFFDGDIDKLSQKLIEISLFSLDVGFPLVVKPNNSSFSRGAKYVDNRNDLISHILVLLREYSEVLIQKFINSREFRVLMFEGEIVFAYERVGDSPIRICHQGAAFKEITEISKAHKDLFSKAARVLELNYGGFDVRSDSLSSDDISNTYILEANSHPTIDTISERKGPEFIRNLYRRLLLFALTKRDLRD